MFKRLNNQRGFTLVELLVVVIILAILAAVVIPQLRSSSQDAKASALDTDLSAMRSSLELYYHQHNSVYPGVKGNHEGVAHASEYDAFVNQLTFCSDASGNTDTTCDTTFKYGPYLKKGVPKNPLPNAATTTDAQASTVTVDAATVMLGNEGKAVDATAAGWYFVRSTGEFFANNTSYDDK
jgi:prepilin-type N-terminal cleavage/methylation domain-containing protein